MPGPKPAGHRELDETRAPGSKKTLDALETAPAGVVKEQVAPVVWHGACVARPSGIPGLRGPRPALALTHCACMRPRADLRPPRQREANPLHCLTEIARGDEKAYLPCVMAGAKSSGEPGQQRSARRCLQLRAACRKAGRIRGGFHHGIQGKSVELFGDLVLIARGRSWCSGLCRRAGGAAALRSPRLFSSLATRGTPSRRHHLGYQFLEQEREASAARGEHT